MYQDIIKDKKSDFENAIEHFKDECSKLRTGRANAAILDGILVEHYGVESPLNQLATISVPEPQLITIAPWDKGAINAIEIAIKTSDLGLNAVNDGQIIRISIPPLTEERRTELVKVLNKKAEEARVSIRNVREDAWRDIQDAEKEGLMSEDDKFKGKDELQKIVDDFNNQIEGIRKKKEGDVMTI